MFVVNWQSKELTEYNLHLKLPNLLFPQSQQKFLRKNKLKPFRSADQYLVLIAKSNASKKDAEYGDGAF